MYNNKNLVPIIFILVLISFCNTTTKDDISPSLENVEVYLPGVSEKTKRDEPIKSEVVGNSSSPSETLTEDKTLTKLPFFYWGFGFRGSLSFLNSIYGEALSTVPKGAIFIDFNPKLINNLYSELEVSYFKTDVFDNALNKFQFLTSIASLKYEYPALQFLALSGALGGGIYYGKLNTNRLTVGNNKYFNWAIQASIGAHVIVDYYYEFGLGGKILYMNDNSVPLQSIEPYLQFSYRLNANPQDVLNKQMKLYIKVGDILPAESNYYAINGIGTLIFSHKLKTKLKSLRASVYINDYMDNSSFSDTFNNINPRSEIKIPLKVTFNSNLFNVTSRKSVSAKIKVEYELENFQTPFFISEDVDLAIQNRNSITWDKTAKVGAFITPTDPPVYEFARNVIKSLETIWNEDKYFIPNNNLKKAMAIWEALCEYGFQYVSDPKGFKSNFGTPELDSVMYPREMLVNRSGDCDDFTALYCSLLESVGVKTAIVTIPGHIFMMFYTNLSEYELNSDIVDREMVAINANDNTVWIPIEITMLGKKKPFFEAWSQGVRNLSTLDKKAKKEFIQVEKCQEMYFPVSLGKFLNRIDNPNPEKYSVTYKSDVDKFKKWLFSNLDTILADMNAYDRHNSKGFLFMKYKMYKKSEVEFLSAYIASKKKKVEPLVNLGILNFYQKKYSIAEGYYFKALKADKKNPKALYGLVLIYDSLGAKEKRNIYLKKLPEKYKNDFIQGSTITVEENNK